MFIGLIRESDKDSSTFEWREIADLGSVKHHDSRVLREPESPSELLITFPHPIQVLLFIKTGHGPAERNNQFHRAAKPARLRCGLSICGR